MIRHAVSWLLILSLTMACHAAPDPGTGTSGVSKQRYRSDCNGNGIADSVDIANGVAPDRNGNGDIDVCDPDPVLRGYGARAWADPPDSLFVNVGYRAYIGIHVNFTVRAKSRGRIVVVDPATELETVLVERVYDRGGHTVKWVPRDSSGAISRFGDLLLAVRVDADSISIPLQWSWGNRPEP